MDVKIYSRVKMVEARMVSVVSVFFEEDVGEQL
jgi:hypothetical protein